MQDVPMLKYYHSFDLRRLGTGIICIAITSTSESVGRETMLQRLLQTDRRIGRKRDLRIQQDERLIGITRFEESSTDVDYSLYLRPLQRWPLQLCVVFGLFPFQALPPPERTLAYLLS
jgi:hypothetical protein